MKKICQNILLVSLLCFIGLYATAQVDVTATGGTLTQSYSTLKAAFAAINAGTHTGAINIGISGSTSETASAVLNASGGAASYTSITIKPTGGVARTIASSFVGHLIDLNGADNVTIDGLNTAGNSLTISNDAGGQSSAIRFVADASNNTIANCSVRGSCNDTYGVIYFATGITTGNDNNNINHCNIFNAGGLPLNGIFSLGTSDSISNSGNVINANNIYDIFLAVAAASNGIDININNTGWTITDNKFFQTASRTALNAKTFHGIVISSGEGYIITGNRIGFANAAGTGTFTIDGSVATRFIGINFAYGTTGATSSVQGNTIGGISINTTSNASTANGVLCGININAGNVNVGNITPNIIGGSSGTDLLKVVSTTTQATVVGIHSATPGAVLIQNNVIGGLSSSGITAAIAGGICGIRVSAAASSINITGNTIGNTTANNMRGGTFGLTTGSSIVTGIHFQVAASNTSMSNNTIQNLASYGSGNAGYVRGIWMPITVNSTLSYTVSNNNILNLTTNSTLSTNTSGQGSAAGVIYNGSNGVVSQNIISNISNTNTGTAGGYVTGLYINVANFTNIFKNKIFNLINAGTSVSATAPSAVVGINLGSGSSKQIVNNMITLGSNQSTNTVFVGIQRSGFLSGYNIVDSIYHNTINIEGNVISGAQPSFGFYRGNFSSSVISGGIVLINNIITNNRTGGTGKHYAIANNYGSTSTETGWPANASNFNVLNASVATIGYWTTDQSFTSWQNISAGDVNSFSAIPVPYVNSTTDLHLNTGATPTVIESGALPIAGFNLDFDNQARPGPTGSINGGAIFADIGADEVDAVPIDNSGPFINYNQPVFTCLTDDKQLNGVNIVDLSGVPTTGSLVPRIYYRKNTGSFFSQPGTLASGNALNGYWDFNIVAADMGGLAQTDTVFYFIIAQDLAATTHIASNPRNVAATDVNNITTAPPLLNSYGIAGTLNGTYNVGVGQTYTTLSAAIKAYSSSCIAGPVIFLLTDTAYNEIGLREINSTYSSAVNTLTIKPAPGVVSVVRTDTTSLTILNSYVTIDGSNNGSGSRDLTIVNNGIFNPVVIRISSTGNATIVNAAVRNCIIRSGNAGTTSYGIFFSDQTFPGAAGYFNNMTILNNSIQKVNTGVSINAVPIAGNGLLVISSNDLATAGANAIGYRGFFIQGVDSTLLQNNQIGNFDSLITVSGLDIVGIYFSTGSKHFTISGNTITNLRHPANTGAYIIGINIFSGLSTATASNFSIRGNIINNLSASGSRTSGIILEGYVTNGIINNNKITNLKNTNTGGYTSCGIEMASAFPNATISFFNNFISDVAAYGFGQDPGHFNGYGIDIEAGGGYSISNNTIVMNNNQTATDGLPAALNVSPEVTAAGAINLLNNIFVSTQTVGTQRYAIFSAAPSSVFGIINFNDYYTTGPNLGFIGSNRADLSALKAGFGGNQNSVTVLPTFVSSTDLHLTPANFALNGRGISVADITTDIDGDLRDTGAPDVGADEFISTPGNLLAVTVPGKDSATYNVSPLSTIYVDTANRRIAKVLPSGVSAVNGLVKTKITLDASVQSYNGVPYVQRHYDIEPVNNSTSATATLTLYFLQSEFDAFNAARGGLPALPSGPADAAGIANLVLTQYHGVGTTPGNYSSFSEPIDPPDSSIVWNAVNNWWEITFNVSGFSGFYVHTSNTLYSFVGNGNWSDASNWLGNRMPPSTLPAGQQIIVDPVAAGECVLDIVQTVSSGGKIFIKPDKKIRLPGNLIIQ